MKVWYISNSRIPTEKAYGIQIMKMCEAFATGGINITLILPTRKSSFSTEGDMYKYYKVKNNFSLKRIWSFDPYFLMKLPQGIYIKFQSFFFIISLFIFLLFHNKKNTIFYTREEYLLPLLLLFSKKVSWECHTLPSNIAFYKKYWKRLSGIIVLTSFLKEKLVSYGIDPNAIVVSPDGVDTEQFLSFSPTNREELGLPANKKIVLYTGHLYDWKGADILAQAAEKLSKDFCVLFVGGTPSDVRHFQKKYGVVSNIRIIGHVPYEQIPSYLSCADVLVIPNSGKSVHSSHYTSPLKFFEYLTTTKPIVASDLPSLREIGVQFQGVYFCQPDDPEVLARSIREAAESDMKFQRDISRFSWRTRAGTIRDFIQYQSS